jgi:hypothetical protein
MASTVAAETICSPDRKLPGNFVSVGHEFAAAIANHELKAFTILVLASMGSQASATALCGEVRDIAHNAGASWIPNYWQPFSYCTRSIEPNGRFVKTRNGTTEMSGNCVELTDKGRWLGVAGAGLICEWSLTYSDSSCQQVFGSSHSTGRSFAPHHRVEVLRQFFSDGSFLAEPSISQLAVLSRAEPDETGYNNRLSNVTCAVKDLENAGVLFIESAYVDNDSLYHVLDGEPEANLTSNVGVALCLYIERLKLQGRSSFCMKECLDEIVPEILATDPTLEPRKVRRKLCSMLGTHSKAAQHRNAVGSDQVVLPGLRRLYNFNGGGLTRVSPVRAQDKAMRALVNIIEAIESQDEAKLSHGYDYGISLLNDPDSTRQLFEKAHANSPAAQKVTRAETARRIMDIISNNGGLNMHDILARHKSEHGRGISKSYGYSILRELVSLQQVRRFTIEPASSAKRHTIYSAS